MRPRVWEWGLLALVLSALATAFWRHAERVQGQAELAALRSTLGSLRTTLVLHQLRQTLPRTDAATVGQGPKGLNPFDLLGAPMGHYLGQRPAEQAPEWPGGSWVFDPACGCVGYRPREPRWVEQPMGAPALWFRVGQADGGPPLQPLETYVWQGQGVE